MMKGITKRVRLSDQVGIFHNSKEDIRSLGKLCNLLIDKNNELIEKVNELEEKVNGKRQ